MNSISNGSAKRADTIQVVAYRNYPSPCGKTDSGFDANDAVDTSGAYDRCICFCPKGDGYL